MVQCLSSTNLCIHKVCIITMIIVLIYDYNTLEVPVLVRIKNPSFTPLGPHNSTLQLKLNYSDRLVDFNDFKYLINSNTCAGMPSNLLTIIVSSNPINVENRQAIRQTWGQTDDTTRLVFLIAVTTDALDSQIHNESALYGDIVQGNFVDAYRNLTYKHVMGLRWVTEYCPNAKYILKTDDDVLVHTEMLKHFLVKELSPWGMKDLILCPRNEHAPVFRTKESKWMVTYEEYSPNYYPTYCLGLVILYSQDVVPRLLEAAQNTTFFWIDDVLVTGILADQIGVPRTNVGNLMLTSTRANILKLSGPQYAGEFLFGPLIMTVKDMRKMWKAIS